MQSSAIVDLLAAAVAEREEDARPPPALIAVFAGVPDPRRRQGRRYPLPLLLCALVLALLCNCATLEALGQWGAEHRALLAAQFPAQRFHTPTGSLYRRLLPRLSVTHLEAALATWVRGSLRAASDEALAFEGKSVRGAGTADALAPPLLSLSTQSTQEPLLPARVAEKTTEIPIARDLLPALPLAGRVVTADALHPCAQTAQAIRAQDAAYFLVIKGNQPTLYAACAAYFSDPTARVGRARTHDRRRGRTETRTLDATTGLNAHLTRYAAFPHIRQVACLLTTLKDQRGTYQDVRFLLTSLPPPRATPARLLLFARGHWSIESRHFVRAVTFGEDRSPLRSGDAPQIMAPLRTLAHTLIRRTGATASAAARRSFSSHPARALGLLLAVP
jgi:predicted transposase YbfD/YdcC